MAHRLLALAVAVGLLLAPAAPAAQRLVDAVLAEVDGTVVTASDVALARALGLAGLAPSAAPLGPEEVERLVDARLVLLEAGRLALAVEPEAVDGAWAAATARIGGPGRLAAWLARAGVTEAWARRAVAEEALVARFVDYRFRAFVLVTEEDVDAALGPGAARDQARVETRERLLAAETGRRLAAWLEETRPRARIRRLLAGGARVPCPLPMPD